MQSTNLTLRVFSVLSIVLLVSGMWPVMNVRAATIVVDSTADGSGVNPAECTLRDAIVAANNNTSVDGCVSGSPGLDWISFDIPVSDPGFTGSYWRIRPASPLPNVTEQVILDGITQTGSSCGAIWSGTAHNLRIEIDGSLSAGGSGLRLQAAGSVVRGLVINQFWEYGIRVESAGNILKCNYIGTSRSGVGILGNGLSGIYIDNVPNTQIGGTGAGEGNLISGNDYHGVHIQGASATNTQVMGNLIGTSIDGVGSVGNGGSGVYIQGAFGNHIGGSTAGARNLISGNTTYGVAITGAAATNNEVKGNYIGTRLDGLSLPADTDNAMGGVWINDGSYNDIGGSSAGEGNLISNNFGFGVMIQGASAAQNTIEGNLIGLDKNGTSGYGNGASGVVITASAHNNTVGGDSAGARNVISDNGAHGISITGSSTGTNFVKGNYIGTDSSGTAAIGNTMNGVMIVGGSDNNVVGGGGTGEGNLISGNLESGVRIEGAGTMNNYVRGNFIGTDVDGDADLGNLNDGVVILFGAQQNDVGGGGAGQGNLISGNEWAGVSIYGDGSMLNTVSGNLIGTDLSGTADLGNTTMGVFIGFEASTNTIGGDTAGERNVISGNDLEGVTIRHANTTNNVVSGNYIGVDITGTLALGNFKDGVLIFDGASGNTIGGSSSALGNLISGNVLSGVSITGSGTDNNKVYSNLIGTDVSGSSAIGNSQFGVFIGYGAEYNTIGDPLIGVKNLISGNNWSGIGIQFAGTANNVVKANYIGTDITGLNELGNLFSGIQLSGGARDNTIDAGNVISGNSEFGIFITGDTTYGNIITDNLIGVDVSGLVDRKNYLGGIRIEGDSFLNTIGPGNLIAHNGIFSPFNGVRVTGTDTDRNTITQNSIYGNTDQGIDLSADGNNELASPVITSASCTGVSGNACTGCTIEIFSDADGEGRIYEGTTTASPAFTWSGSVAGTQVTATARDGDGNTSEFSTPYVVGNCKGSPVDFAGNLESDVVVFRGGAWRFFDYDTASFDHGVWTGSSPGCIPAPGDFDGDGEVEPSQLCGGAWHFYHDDGSYNKGIWTGGLAGDLPVPADFNGDGTDDVVVWRAGAWRFFNFITGAFDHGVWTGSPPHWLGGTSMPIPMDYDGDGRAEFTVWSGGPWHFYNDDGSYKTGIWTGGVAGDLPIPADYNGGIKEEIVVWRAGAWRFFDLGTGQFVYGVWTGSPPHWLGGTSLPAPIDYDGDGYDEFTVWSGGPWHFYDASGVYVKGIWTGGVAGDLPISRRLLP